MDTRSRKWTNKVLITLVMIVMTLSGIYGLNTIHNMAVTGDNSFSLDEQVNQTISNTHRCHCLTNGRIKKVIKSIIHRQIMCQKVY